MPLSCPRARLDWKLSVLCGKMIILLYLFMDAIVHSQKTLWEDDFMRKSIAILAVAVYAVAVMPVTAFAHGHGGGVAVRQGYSLCNVDNCNTVGIHQHGGTYYCGHSIGDGHDYHRLCNVQGCTLTGVHEHDGVTCFAHYSNDGHIYHNTNSHTAGRHLS